MTVHPSLTEIDRYAAADDTLDEATVWAVEIHLEDCSDCRARLAGSTTGASRDLVARVAATVHAEIASGPPPARSRPWSALRTRWLVGTLLPWVAMAVTALGCAAVLVLLRPGWPAVALLFAPLAPLPGVAAAWHRRTDPAWELIAATPAAGLTMLLRRTAGILVFVVPALALTGVGIGVSLALMLLPSLAFTVAALLLGTVVGVRRAAVGLAAAWSLAVIVPGLATTRLPAALEPGSAGMWALAVVALAAVAVLRADSFRRLPTSG